MKKLFTCLMATLMSACLFGQTPTQVDLQSFMEDGYYVACFQAPAGSTCNDIYWVGEYGLGWTVDGALENYVRCEELAGFAGWYVAKVPANQGTNGKPIQLTECAELTWDGQPGTTVPTELIAGSVNINLSYSSEYDFNGWSTIEPTIITIGAWKNGFNPCGKDCPKQSYTIRIYPPQCWYLPDLVPTIKGSFNLWGDGIAMEYNGSYYEYVTPPVRDDFEFKFNNDINGSWDHVFEGYNAETGSWTSLPEFGNFSLTNGTEYYQYDSINRILTFDFSNNELFRYAGCESVPDTTPYTVYVSLELPSFAPAAVEIIGSFDGWTGTPLTYNENDGKWSAVLQDVIENDEFKIREAGTWDNELTFNNQPLYLEFREVWTDSEEFDVKVMDLPFGGEEFGWTNPVIPTATITDGSNPSQGYIRGIGTYDIGTTQTLTAVPNYGYHFTQWLDSVTDNPRSITLTQDTTFTALFEKNPVPYLYCDSTMGYVYYRSFADSFPDMPKAYEYYEIFAEPYNGHHFVTWSDGNLEQTYRIIHITHDTVISATFAKNQYEVRTMPNYLSYGSTKGDTLVYYGDSVTIEATPNYGYHFGYWELGVYNYYGWQDTTSTNPVTIAIGENRICTAIFWPNTYRVICSSTDPEQGTVTADKRWADYLDSVHVTATPNYGYHFVRWTDGNTENPRRFFITQDTTFTAVFAIDRTGTCGDNMALNWQYDPTSYLLTISGNGTLNSNFTFGAEAPTQVQKLVVAEGVTTIGNSAFANYATLQEISLPTTLRTIYEQAFYNCVGLTHIYNFRERPCVAYSNTFDGIDKFDCTLHVLAESESMYRAATGWRDFYYIQPMEVGTVTVPEDSVIVEPTVNTVTLTWPVEENAASYTIEIYKEGVLVCTLIFNANGQLTGIAFAAPSREKHSHAPAALMTANGMQFTVTGLEGGTNYTYSVITKDAEEEVVASYEGEFTTVSQVPTAIDEINANANAVKIFRNGQLLILRGDKTYTLTGQELR